MAAARRRGIWQTALLGLALLAPGCKDESSPAKGGAGEASTPATTSTTETADPAAEALSAHQAEQEEAVHVPASEFDVVAESAFGPEVKGLMLKRSIVVRGAPHDQAEKLGVVAAHTVVGYRRAAKGPGCESRWIEIEPRGWVCESYFETSKKRPHGVELPKLRSGELVPGTYGKVIGEEPVLVSIEGGAITDETPVVGSATFRKRGETTVEGERYWKVKGGKYIAESLLRIHKPSRFRGVRLADGSDIELPMIFAVSSGRPGDWVPVRDAPTGGARLRRVKARSTHHVFETKRDEAGKAIAHRIGEGEWVAAADARYAETLEAPDLTEPGERWVDVDLDQQLLVAYEGELPVFATLIASGTKKNATETGIFRVWIKFSETDMSGRMGESDAYSVATVPWTQFYENDFALHTSYWHDRFGQKRSHGCVNLSPADARFMYFWSEPQVPVGWSMANSSSQRPGSMVRVRSRVDPNPSFQGHALEVYERRKARKASGA